MAAHAGWLAHDRRGEGPPLVLIHGIGSRWQVFAPIIPELALYRDVIAVDLPGFGASRPERGCDRIPVMAGRVADFLDSLGIRQPDVAGSSMGGTIALELGRLGLARSVTAFSPAGFWGTPGRLWCQAAVRTARGLSVALRPALPGLAATRFGRAALCGAFYGRPTWVDEATCLADATALRESAGFADGCAALAAWQLPRAAFRHADPGPVDVWRLPEARHGGAGRPGTRRAVDLSALRDIPVTIAWGTRDAILPYRTQAARARAALPLAAHVALAGCGHLPFSDAPATCVVAIVRTIQRAKRVGTDDTRA